MRCCLRESLGWLDSKIQADGSFGTDHWDALRLGITIEQNKLHSLFPSCDRLKASLVNAIRTNSLLTGKSTWIGPGFLAAAADYADLLGMVTEGDALVARLIGCQSGDGSWVGVKGPDQIPLVSPVWHTSQAVWVLARRGLTEHGAAVARATDWLKSTQHAEGYWGGPQQFIIYFTAYAVTALLKAPQPDRSAIRKGIDYLKGIMTPDGKCSDMGGTLLCAFALRNFIGSDFAHNLSVVDFVLSRNNLLRAEAAEQESIRRREEASSLKTRLTEMESRYENLAAKFSGAEVILTKRAFAIITLISIFLAIALPLTTVLITNEFPRSTTDKTSPSLRPAATITNTTLTSTPVTGQTDAVSTNAPVETHK